MIGHRADVVLARSALIVTTWILKCRVSVVDGGDGVGVCF